MTSLRNQNNINKTVVTADNKKDMCVCMGQITTTSEDGTETRTGGGIYALGEKPPQVCKNETEAEVELEVKEEDEDCIFTNSCESVENEDVVIETDEDLNNYCRNQFDLGSFNDFRCNYGYVNEMSGTFFFPTFVSERTNVPVITTEEEVGLEN